MSDALHKVWEQGNWTVYVDELKAFMDLGLYSHLDRIFTQGRERKISGHWLGASPFTHTSLVVGMQRPVDVTRYALGESSHVLCASLEGRDQKTIREACGMDMEDAVSNLERHEFAWFYRPTREIWIGKIQDLMEVTEDSKALAYGR